MMVQALRLKTSWRAEDWVKLAVCSWGENAEESILTFPDTSKYESETSLYGSQGSFLASVAALSILTITSRHKSYRPLSSLVLHHSRPAARILPAPTHHELPGHGHGTRVTVQDLFGNMPVRVKQRSAMFFENTKGDEKEMEGLKKRLVALLLAWHSPVHLNLCDAGGKNRKLIVRKLLDLESIEVRSGSKEPQKSSQRNIGGGINLALTCSLLSQAGFIEPGDTASWIKTSGRTPRIAVKGAISLEPAPSRQVQFISLGVRPLTQNGVNNVLYDEVNQLFAASSFGNSEEQEVDESVKSKDRRYKQNGFTNRQLKGVGKGVDRWPMFYIRIDLQDNEDEKRLERESVLANVSKVLRAMMLGFLRDNHFRPRANVSSRRRPLFEAQGNDRGTFPIDAFSHWSRIKSSQTFRAEGTTSTTNPKPVENEIEQEGSHLKSPKPPASLGATTSNVPTINATEPERIIEWTNPADMSKVLVSSRTGNIVRSASLDERPSTAPALLQNSSRATNRLTRKPSAPLPSIRPGSWASDLLSKWQNPVFAIAETPVPRVSSSLNHEASSTIHGSGHGCSHGNIQSTFTPTTAPSAKLSKQALSNARVISQVDGKFILISMPNTKRSQTLVLIDQHAADERIRVEALIDELTALPPAKLPKPLVFEVPKRDYELLATQTAYFARWGIIFDSSTGPQATTTPNTIDRSNRTSRINAAEHHVITTAALPQAIAERCRQEPKLIIDLLRREAWRLAEHPAPAPAHTHNPRDSAAHDDHKTITPHTSIPPGLLEMLNSRACRSAIMFNDPLTQREAEMLVRRLSKTRLPFQCAHGRPSMVPLVELGVVGDKEEEGRRMGPDADGFGVGEEAAAGVGVKATSGLFEARDVDDGGDEVPGEFVKAWRKWRAGERGDGKVE